MTVAGQAIEPVPVEPLVLEPGGADRRFWYDLWHYRDLFVFLAWRDIAVRYCYRS